MTHHNINSRIRNVRGEIDQGTFAKMAGVSQSLLSAVETEARKASADLILKLHQKLGVSIGWLVTGHGEPYINSGISEKPPSYGSAIPIITSASANPQSRIEFEAIDDEWTHFRPGLVAIRIQDESMSPIVWPGQLVICDPEASIKDGDLAVVKIKHRGTMFKRVHFDKKHGLVVLQSINPARDEPPLNIMKEDVEFQYKVIAVKFE